METNTKFLFLALHMESEVTTTEENGVLIDGTAYRDANRVLHNIHATVHRIGPNAYEAVRNEKKSRITSDIKFCTADLYFHEPIGLTSVFSNMYAAELKLAKEADGRYHVFTTDDDDSFYTYKNGKLESVEVDTVMGKITSLR